MHHIRPISARPGLAQGALTPVEQLIVVVLSILYADNPNASQVISNLEKYYRKTP